MRHKRRHTQRSVIAGLLVATACSGGEPAVEDVEFLDVRVEELTHNRVVIRFETSRETSCEVEYGIRTGMDDTPNLDQSATDPNMEPGTFSIDHEVPIEDLEAERTYYFRMRATDPEGRTYFSEVDSFKTLVGPVRDGNMINVAQMAMGSAVAEVSSNWSNGANDSSFGANNAIDGMMGTEWSSAGDGDGAWITIDFGQMRTIERFGFRSRKMSDGTSIIKSSRLILDDQTELGPFDTPDPDQTYTFSIGPVQTTRIRLEAIETTSGNTGIKELQFFEAQE